MAEGRERKIVKILPRRDYQVNTKVMQLFN